MSSWFSQLSSTVSNAAGLVTVDSIKTISDTVKDGQYYTPLDQKDLEWTLASGSSTENQVFYTTSRKGAFAFVQLIHSNIGLWNPTISFTCRFYDPETKTSFFKTISMTKFDLSSDRCSVKTDFFSIQLDAAQNLYRINITHPQVVVSLEFKRIDKGFKVGEGKTFLGGDDAKSAGFVSHKFWPRAESKGTFIIDQQIHDIEGEGIFIHAIQGMQPQLIATHWNFIDFHSNEASINMMQFKTTKQYGSVSINQGSLVLNDKLVCVCVDNHLELLDLERDPETEYDVPKRIKLTWKGKTIKEQGEVKDVNITMLGETKNLLDKIDVLAEIPFVVRKIVQTFVVKPYIYQWLDQVKAEITIGDKTIVTEGHCFQELVFVSKF